MERRFAIVTWPVPQERVEVAAAHDRADWSDELAADGSGMVAAAFAVWARGAGWLGQ